MFPISQSSCRSFTSTGQHRTTAQPIEAILRSSPLAVAIEPREYRHLNLLMIGKLRVADDMDGGDMPFLRICTRDLRPVCT
ncbi:hypothetical protein XH99_29545 [Bradyrhizobium nanningense]|uniref:Uncharacterized protein n=1 Tax=Bradyrhizobium nanningense TaxID=1325118 RepID=A0A4Q0RYK4_9BRAD|nr:hypothetical protein XH99_29545 [Bradyrhizobium nanningense]RXH29237.1 hypothetical protein XH84_22240 [Bradyrhizobium nanningense]